MKYDIFISYKRLGVSKNTASALYNLLVQKGYNVFLDRKELRSGDFNKQLLEHIANATDVIILLEEHSLDSWFAHQSQQPSADPAFGMEILQQTPYKTDWFCKEVMHALSQEGKNIVPILLDGYEMPAPEKLPPEMQALAYRQALSLSDIIDLDDLYGETLLGKEYLHARPQNMALSRQYRNEGSIVSRYLFYSDASSCELYEQGERIQTLTEEHDEQHPFVYPVQFAGEHRFQVFNNDTCEQMLVTKSVNTSSQVYVPIIWIEKQSLWTLTSKQITAQRNTDQLFRWGKGLFEGTPKNAPDLERATICMKQAIARSCKEALEYVLTHETADASTDYGWTELAAANGSVPAMLRLGAAYSAAGQGQSLPDALRWFEKAASCGSAEAAYNAGILCLGGSDAYNSRMENTRGNTLDSRQAFYYFKKAAELGYTAAYSNLARYLYRIGDWTSAFHWAHEAFAADPTDLHAAKTILRIYVAADNEPKTEKWLDICLQLLQNRGAGPEEQEAFKADVLVPDRELINRANNPKKMMYKYPNL